MKTVPVQGKHMLKTERKLCKMGSSQIKKHTECPFTNRNNQL